jgi:hypothetical protein
MKTSFCLVVALTLVAGGCGPAPSPFDPGTDCPKLSYCGQCASRGGCAWCGDPKESSGGQCVAVGHSECGAPRAWAKTPETCPAPPADAGAPASSASSTATAEASPEQKAVGPEKLAAVRRALTRAFPQATVTEDVVSATVRLLREGPAPTASAARAAPREAAPISRRVQEKEHHLYLGDATHHRVKSISPASQPMQSEFTMALPMVRVTLPEKLDAANTTIATEIGDVDLSRDHLLGSIDLLHAKYGDAKHLGYRPARVDIITPARLANGRFGAMAIYLGYRGKTDRGPSFYMLEAGTATGDAKMIYFSPDMKPIASVTSYYLPTPFVSMRNTYSGGLTMQPAPNEDEPAQLVVNSFAVGEKDPYITVTVKYKRAPTMDVPLPVEITADAGARVALIAKTMGIESAVDLQGVLADLAKTFNWREYPHYETPAAPATSAPPAATSAPPAVPR